MNRTLPSLFGFAAAAALAAGIPSAIADDFRDFDSNLSVTVAFGAGLNTAGAPNHLILPKRIKVGKGGVVNFVVAGLHQVFVYQPGKRPQDVAVPADGTFIDDLNSIFYQGIHPINAPPTGQTNARNRVESVSFPERGTYLVICNVRTHFLDGMLAFVDVN